MVLPLTKATFFDALQAHDPGSIAIVDSASHQRVSYGKLLQDVASAKLSLEHLLQSTTSSVQVVSFLLNGGYDYVVTMLAIFSAGALALPLPPEFPNVELQYIIEDSGSLLMLASQNLLQKATEVASPQVAVVGVQSLLKTAQEGQLSQLQNDTGNKAGILVYTSGTTNRPKGVNLALEVLTAQCQSLFVAWKYGVQDLVLNSMPLHHMHGILTALLAPLFSGSTVELHHPFDPMAVLKRFARSSHLSSQAREAQITVFTAVPTMYSLMIEMYRRLTDTEQAVVTKSLSQDVLRLTICGSAALPTPLVRGWNQISNGNTLLQRYGMTEVGMAISCGLALNERVDSSVGWPLPMVQVRLVDVDTQQVIEPDDTTRQVGRMGEIQLRGPTVFTGYWRNPAATENEFVSATDGGGPWFRTGDIADRRMISLTELSKDGSNWACGPMYFIHGRSSVDILKSGGEKVSALEVERELLALPQIKEAAVVGVDSATRGQRIGAVVVLHPSQEQTGIRGKPWGIIDMRRALMSRLAPYKIPQVLKIRETIPRNAIGKVNKAELVRAVFV